MFILFLWLANAAEFWGGWHNDGVGTGWFDVGANSGHGRAVAFGIDL